MESWSEMTEPERTRSLGYRIFSEEFISTHWSGMTEWQKNVCIVNQVVSEEFIKGHWSEMTKEQRRECYASQSLSEEFILAHWGTMEDMDRVLCCRYQDLSEEAVSTLWGSMTRYQKEGILNRYPNLWDNISVERCEKKEEQKGGNNMKTLTDNDVAVRKEGLLGYFKKHGNQVGACESCKYFMTEYDGHNWSDKEVCYIKEKVDEAMNDIFINNPEITPVAHDKVGVEVECPLWEHFHYCKKHLKWNRTGAGCKQCEEEDLRRKEDALRNKLRDTIESLDADNKSKDENIEIVKEISRLVKTLRKNIEEGEDE